MQILDKEVRGITGKLILWIIGGMITTILSVLGAYYGIVLSNHDLANELREERLMRINDSSLKEIKINNIELKQTDFKHQLDLNTASLQALFEKNRR